MSAPTPPDRRAVEAKLAEQLKHRYPHPYVTWDDLDVLRATPPLTPSAAAIEAGTDPAGAAERLKWAARALWRIGNERIGFREWETVRDHYMEEAAAALAAVGFESLMSTLGDCQNSHTHLEAKLTEMKTARPAPLTVARLVALLKEYHDLLDSGDVAFTDRTYEHHAAWLLPRLTGVAE